MPKNSISSVGSQTGNQQSTGAARPDRMTDQQKVELILGKGADPNDLSDTQLATLGSLKKTLNEWTGRARGCATEDIIKLSKLSSAQHMGCGTRVSLRGQRYKVGSQYVAQLLDIEADRAVKTENTRLARTYGAKDNRTVSLISKYKGFVKALQARAFGTTGKADVEERQQGLTNLQLFIRHGGKLHSTSRDRKLERTLAKIPAKVLKKASGHVNTLDYAVAEHLGIGVADHVQGGRKLPLLSFHGFKATKSWFGMDNKSRAYREDLRAITASAHILGGVGKALKVKQLLTEIESRGGKPEVGGRREDMAKRVLENLETHCDPDALIEDLQFELRRHDILRGVRESRYDGAKKLYPQIRDTIAKLSANPNRATIIASIGYLIGQQIDGKQNIKGYRADNPENLLRDLEFIAEENPIASFMERQPGNADAARFAVALWVRLMTSADSGDRAKLNIQMDKIRSGQYEDDQDDTYLNAVHTFGLIDKTEMSAESQSALLLSCLSHPDHPADYHLAQIDGGNGGGTDLDVTDELQFNEDPDFSEDKDLNFDSDTEKIDIKTSNQGGVNPDKNANLDDVNPMYNVVDEDDDDWNYNLDDEVNDLYDSDSSNDSQNTDDLKKDISTSSDLGMQGSQNRTSGDESES